VSPASLSHAVSSVSSVSAAPEFLRAVWEVAKQKPMPAVASRYYLPGLRLLIALCAELQIAAREATFYISCRDAGALIGEDFRRVSRWLKRLEADGVIVRVATGSLTSRKANEYRFLGGQS
jgi:hypothetical protein